GELEYDYLVLAIGTETNFFGNEKMASLAIPMKSVSEALYLRNRILNDYERALTELDFDKRQGYLDIVVVGGGPTGVEVSGSLAEMRKYIAPKDYPELNRNEIDVYLIEGGPALLGGMSAQSSKKAQQFLEELGVKVKLNTLVTDYDGEWVHMNDGTSIRANKVIWAAGVRGSKMDGLTKEMMGPANRIKVNRHNQIEAFPNIFAIGDIAYMTEEKYPKGHPQVAQVALQQAKTLGINLKRILKGRALEEFSYKDKGSMATIGRNLAVVDLPFIRFQGAFAWFIWMFVHLFTLLGVKNKVFVFINWVWNYFTYDQSLRLIIKPRVPREELVKDAIVQGG
ncbi:MAG: NAD(P)/FAD-dependent oxidoreductase, partial [Saprospiraceae bacterium]